MVRQSRAARPCPDGLTARWHLEDELIQNHVWTVPRPQWIPWNLSHACEEPEGCRISGRGPSSWLPRCDIRGTSRRGFREPEPGSPTRPEHFVCWSMAPEPASPSEGPCGRGEPVLRGLVTPGAGARLRVPHALSSGSSSLPVPPEQLGRGRPPGAHPTYLWGLLSRTTGAPPTALEAGQPRSGCQQSRCLTRAPSSFADAHFSLSSRGGHAVHPHFLISPLLLLPSFSEM